VSAVLLHCAFKIEFAESLYGLTAVAYQQINLTR